MARVLILIFWLLSGLAVAQDSNIPLDIASIEQMLADDSISFIPPKDIRFKGDAAKTTIMKRADGFFFRVKIKRAPQGGEGYNNQPRYEIAAYQLQKLFLDPDDYVVPPTAARAIPIDQYEEFEANLFPTFRKTRVVFCTVQYWLSKVSADNVFDAARLQHDSGYAYHVANLNILTYLIRHSDSNKGNLLISTDPDNPRVFAVDNGMAFANITSERGYDWREMRIERLPEKTISRLRSITREHLQETLGVVAQFSGTGDQFVATSSGANLDANRGVRFQNGIVQFGLTAKEIDQLWNRMRALLQQIDDGQMQLTSF